jgi:hypothetical protein
MEENWARAARCGPIGLADESGQLLVDEGHELGLAQRADLGGRQLAILEQHQRRNATDAELGRDFAVFVDVHLGDLQLACVGGGHFVQDRGNHLAGAAPFGPVVHQHRLGGFEDIGLERGVGNMFDQVAGHDGILVVRGDAAKVRAL